MSVVVVAYVSPRSGERDTVLEALEKVIPQSHAEDEGCLLYALHEDERGRLVFIEKWTDEAALQGHLSHPRTAALTAQLEGLLEGPIEAEILRPHPVGSTKGEL
jgi:quinol monooxygenase YgiN